MQRQAAQQGGTPLTRWIRQYFPELLPVVKGWQGQGTLWVLDHLPLPEEMGRVGVGWIPEGVLGATAHRVRRKPARALGQAAAESIGPERPGGRPTSIASVLVRVAGGPAGHARPLNGAGGGVTECARVRAALVATPLGALGDPRPGLKMAGLNLTHQSSGQHRGQTHIT
jgi:hypothetical protein